MAAKKVLSLISMKFELELKPDFSIELGHLAPGPQIVASKLVLGEKRFRDALWQALEQLDDEYFSR